MDGIAPPEQFFRNLSGFPWEFKQWSHSELRLRYVEVGPSDGPLCLFFHGLPTWSYEFRFLLPLLAEAEFRAVAIDWPGWGASDSFAGSAPGLSSLDWAQAFAASFDASPFAIVASGLGVVPAMHCLAANPANVTAFFINPVTSAWVLPYRQQCVENLPPSQILSSTGLPLPPPFVKGFDAPWTARSTEPALAHLYLQTKRLTLPNPRLGYHATTVIRTHERYKNTAEHLGSGDHMTWLEPDWATDQPWPCETRAPEIFQLIAGSFGHDDQAREA